MRLFRTKNFLLDYFSCMSDKFLLCFEWSFYLSKQKQPGRSYLSNSSRHALACFAREGAARFRSPLAVPTSRWCGTASPRPTYGPQRHLAWPNFFVTQSEILQISRKFRLHLLELENESLNPGIRGFTPIINQSCPESLISLGPATPDSRFSACENKSHSMTSQSQCFKGWNTNLA